MSDAQTRVFIIARLLRFKLTGLELAPALTSRAHLTTFGWNRCANYRQTVLTAFQEVEDNLSTLRVLEEQSKAQRIAVEAAGQSLELSLNLYKGGLVTYLQVISAQSIALQNEYTEVDILRRQMDASVLLIKALGGGWDVSKLPGT